MLVGFPAIFIISSDRRSSTSVSQDARNISTQNGNRTGTAIVTSPSANGQQDADVVDIKGRWNFEQAQKIALSYLRNNDWNNIKDFCVVDLCTPVHTIVGQYNLLYRNRETLIVATASIEKESNCHACAPYLSFFEFEKRPNGWKLVNSYIAALRWGQWGKIEPNELKVYVIGNNLYGIQVDGAGMSQGSLVGNMSIYTQVGDSLHEVLTFQTIESNAQARTDENRIPETFWESHIKVLPGTTGFFDLLVESKGIREGKPFLERKLFKFDGQKYTTSELYQ